MRALLSSTGTAATAPVPKALITLHGGHLYSGPLAIAAASHSRGGVDPLG
jgi:hypothetical protein